MGSSISKSTETSNNAKKTSRIGLLEMPVEIMLDIFLGTLSDSSRDLYALATSSRHLYTIFKENRFTLLHRAFMEILRVCYCYIARDGPLASYFIRIGILRSIRPWPTDPIVIRLALADAADSDMSAKFVGSPSTYGGILAWIRCEAADPTWHRPDGDRRIHPFDSINPANVFHFRDQGRNGRSEFLCAGLRKEIEVYATSRPTDFEEGEGTGRNHERPSMLQDRDMLLL